MDEVINDPTAAEDDRNADQDRDEQGHGIPPQAVKIEAVCKRRPAGPGSLLAGLVPLLLFGVTARDA
jgi:hypothetical protein